jgi:hypothetical protein
MEPASYGKLKPAPLLYFCLIQPNTMKRYLSDKNALTVVASLFCLVMIVISLIVRQSVWEAVGFALAFSFSVEVLCHRAKENK